MECGLRSAAAVRRPHPCPHSRRHTTITAQHITLRHGTETDWIATDNVGARDLAYNPEHHARTKHIERRHFFIREVVESGKLVVPFVSTHDNLADFFTKALPPKRFFEIRDKIMNVPAHLRAT